MRSTLTTATIVRFATALLVLLALPATVRAQEVLEYYGTDALGTVRVVYTPAGTLVARTDLLPFGEPLEATPGGPPEQFTGQERDPEAGQDYFHARMYQPRAGRFTGVDPVYAGRFDPQQWNRHAYGRNSPLGFADPTGMFAVDSNCRAEQGAKWCPTIGNIDDVFDANKKGYQGGELDAWYGRYSAAADNSFGWITVDDAALGAFTFIIPESFASGHEWGGLLYKSDETGRFHFTAPVTDHWPDRVMILDRPDQTGRLPRGSQLAGTYHTHPPPFGYPGNSGTDVRNADHRRVPSYVADPSGVVWKYTPGRGEIALPRRVSLPPGYKPPVIDYGGRNVPRVF